MSSISSITKMFEEFCITFPETSEDAKLSIKKMLKIEEKVECKGIKADKSKCTLPAKENGFCGKHNPDKKVVKAESDSEEEKPKAKAPKKKVVKAESESEEEKPKAKAPKKKKVESESEEEKPKAKAPKKKKVESESEEEKPKAKASPKKKKVVEEETEEVPKVKSPPKKKVVEQECNFTNPKTHVKCPQAGTVKPEGAAFHYCKRHSEKAAEIEKSLNEKIEEEEEEVVIDECEFE